MADIFLRMDSWNAGITLCCCVPDHRSNKQKDSDTLFSCHRFLIDQPLKR